MGLNKKNKNQQNKQSFIEGAIILSVSMVLIKVIGAFFKIPLVYILGDDGSGYFYFSYDIFNLVLSIATAGLPIAVSKLVAEYSSCGRLKDVKKIMNLSTFIFVVTGTIGMLVILIFAHRIVGEYATPQNYLAVLCIGPAVLFLCLMSAYRGYYEGMRNMIPTAISQCIEALSKTIIGLALAYGVREYGLRQYVETGKVFGQSIFLGKHIENIEMAKSAVAPYSAAAAILGVTVSTFIGFVFLFIYRRIKGDGIDKNLLDRSPKANSNKYLFNKLLFLAIPVCLGSLVLSLSSVIDSATVIKRINDAIAISPEYMSDSYREFLDGKSIDALANKLFGTYKGFTLSIFNLVPSFTTAFAVSALPTVASSWANKNKVKTQENIESVLRITSLICIPAGFCMMFLSEPILQIVYGRNNPIAVDIAIPLLSLMGISVIFVSLASPINAMLQAVGKAHIPVIFMVIGAVMKIISNNILISIPEVNIKGVPVGTIICYAFIVIAGLIKLLMVTKAKIKISKVFIKPIIAGLFCAVSAYLVYDSLYKIVFNQSSFTQIISFLLAVFVAVFMYILVLILLRGVGVEDIKLLPKGEKILKRLEKHKRIM